MSQLTNGTEKWITPSTEHIIVSKKNGININFSTANKFVHKDISVDVDVREISGSIGGTPTAGGADVTLANTNSVKTVSSPTGTAGTDYWEIKATPTATNGGYAPKYTVSTSGWLDSTVTGSKQTVTVTPAAAKSLYIDKASISATSVTPSSSSQSVTVGEGYTKGATITVAAVSKDTAKSIVGTGAISTAAKTADVTAFTTTNTTAVVPTEGYLTLTEGWYPATKISLATLVPDIATADRATASWIRSGKKAWDSDGKEILGTLGNATVKSGAATVSTVSPSYNNTNGNYSLTYTGTIAAPTVPASGCVGSIDGSTVGTLQTNNSITGGTLAKAKLTASKGADGKVTPQISNATTTATAGHEQVALSPSITAPAANVGDKYYVAVSTEAINATTAVSINVDTAGYTDNTNKDATGVSVTRGANSSGIYYASIPTATFQASDGAITVKTAGYIGEGDTVGSISGGALSADDSAVSLGNTLSMGSVDTSTWKIPVTATASGTAYAKVTTAGYVTSNENASKTLSATKEYTMDVYDGTYTVS